MGFWEIASSGLEIGVTHRLLTRSGEALSEDDFISPVDEVVDAAEVVTEDEGVLSVASANLTDLLSAFFFSFSMAFFSNPRRSISFFTLTSSWCACKRRKQR